MVMIFVVVLKCSRSTHLIDEFNWGIFKQMYFTKHDVVGNRCREEDQRCLIQENVAHSNFWLSTDTVIILSKQNIETFDDQ
jgi:hypothetical protein